MSEPQIAQAEIEHVVALREQAREARAAANKKQVELEAEEERLITALQAGTPVESGAYFLLVRTEQIGRSVAWRGVVERELGKPFAEKTLADISPGERTVLKVLHEVTVDGAALEKHIVHRGRR